MFEKELKKIEATLDIPYPERHLFLLELKNDIEMVFLQLRSKGLSEREAEQLAVKEFCLSRDDISKLSSVHASIVARMMRMLPQPLAKRVEDISGIVPLVGFTAFSIKEWSMVDFLNEGGLPFVIIVILMGGYGLSSNLKHAFRWFVLRDHSQKSLSNFSSTPLYLAAATFLLGVLATAAGYRNVFVRWSQGDLSDAVIRAGFSEPLAGLIVATSIAGLIILIHGWLSIWRERVQI